MTFRDDDIVIYPAMQPIAEWAIARYPQLCEPVGVETWKWKQKRARSTLAHVTTVTAFVLKPPRDNPDGWTPYSPELLFGNGMRRSPSGTWKNWTINSRELTAETFVDQAFNSYVTVSMLADRTGATYVRRTGG